jgi:hypothetical protein
MAYDLLPISASGGVPFIDYVQGRVGRRSAQRVLAFIQEWDVLADELGREPTIKEYQERWKMSRATAYNDQRLFQLAFPGEQTPRAILDALWDLRTNFGPLLAAKVAVTGSNTPPVQVGQLWLGSEGAFYRIIEIDGDTVHTNRYDSPDARKADTRFAQSFSEMRIVGGPEADIWAVAVQTDANPDAAIRHLAEANFVLDVLSAPSPDWGGVSSMRSATLELRGVAGSEGDLRRVIYQALEPLGVGPRDIAIRSRRLQR